MKRKTVHETRHPFDDLPFEAVCCGSWNAVESIEVRNGSATVRFADRGHEIEGKGPFANLRVKSRQATLADCTCLLRPSMDVCVLLPFKDANSSDDVDQKMVWVDVKIRSIERKPHECQCLCQFYVSRYVNQGPLGSERMILDKETECIGIHQILILQRIEGFPVEGQYYRWDCSEDCSLVRRTKVLLGKFLSDITWLLVASALKKFSFAVRSLQNKIVYEILDREDDQSDNLHNSLNFKVDNDIRTPIVFQFVLPDVNDVNLASSNEKELSPLNADVNLRRSKRRNVQPERFEGCDILSGIGWVRTMPIKYAKYEDDDELYLPLSYLICPKECFPDKQTEELEVPEAEPLEDCSVSKTKFRSRTRRKSKDVKSTTVKKMKHQKSIDPEREEGNSFSGQLKSSQHRPRTSSGDKVNKIGYTDLDKRASTAKVKSWFEEEDSRKRSSTGRAKRRFEEEDMVVQSSWKRKFYGKQVVWKRRPVVVKKRREDTFDSKMHRKMPLSASAYNQLINSYMRNIDSAIMSKEEPRIIDQWEEFKAKSRKVQEEEMEPIGFLEDGECSEIEMLWREMEISLASAYLMEDDKAFVSGSKSQKSSESCQHDFKTDEEIGVLCLLCGFVKTEIRYVSPLISKESEAGWTEGRMPNEENPEVMAHQDDTFNIAREPAHNEDTPLCEENENVWALIPDIRKKLHAHQKKAFEFLWRNIAGSLEPGRMKKASKKIGGCVVSHTPGAGKTFLIIAFLSSFLKLFPGKRPLILAPKTTLYTWYKEFIKWEMPFPVQLIHGSGSYRRFQDRKTTFRGGPRPNQDVMHILDCLEKIQKWHAQPSVLVMGYTSFLTFMREDSRFVYRKYMAKILRESPGLLVLDEGHNPRSTKSRLRKVLMKVDTDLRILLSGTLFQNNFGEYFNTLCLARPKFIKEVLKELDKKYKTRNKGEEKARHLLESRARKFFADNIARKIDSSEAKERMKGLDQLRKMTNKFIDVYEGGASDGLPGLQIYTILMNLSEMQHKIAMKLQQIMAGVPGYPLELELLITLASIHPWLVKSSNCVNKFFDEKELSEFEKLKFDVKKGSKVMFVLNLVYRVIKHEKVLIFCHNIAPINLFAVLFETVFRWQKGKEIMVLTGDLELFERGRIIDKFEEPGGPSRVLLASISACAEGISLTAASRVIMLDSEWNPSKTKQAIARAFRPGQQKMVYVYQLLATGTLEEDKHKRTTWKDWVSRMIFSEEFVEDPSRWQAEKIEDEVLREMVAEDRLKSFHMIMKNEKASTG